MFSGGAHCSSNSIGYPSRVIMKGDRGSEGSAGRKKKKTFAIKILERCGFLQRDTFESWQGVSYRILIRD